MIIAESIAKTLAPGIRLQLVARRTEILGAAGLNFAVRAAFSLAWPYFLKLLPWLLEVCVKEVLDHFGGLKLTELLEDVQSHKKQGAGVVPPPRFDPE